MAKEGLHLWWLCLQVTGLDTALRGGDVIPGWKELQWQISA